MLIKFEILTACSGVSKSTFKLASISTALTVCPTAVCSPKKVPYVDAGLIAVGSSIKLILSLAFAVDNAVFSELVTNCTNPVPVVTSTYT